MAGNQPERDPHEQGQEERVVAPQERQGNPFHLPRLLEVGGVATVICAGGRGRKPRNPADAGLWWNIKEWGIIFIIVFIVLWLRQLFHVLLSRMLSAPDAPRLETAPAPAALPRPPAAAQPRPAAPAQPVPLTPEQERRLSALITDFLRIDQITIPEALAAPQSLTEGVARFIIFLPILTLPTLQRMRQEARDNPSNTDVRNRFKALIIAFFNRLSPQLLEAWVGCRVPTPLSEVTRLDPVVPPNRGDVPERPLESLAIDSVMQSVEDPNFVQLLPMLPQDRMHPFFSQFLRRAQSHNEPRDNLRHDLLVHIRTEVLGGGEAVVECPVM